MIADTLRIALGWLAPILFICAIALGAFAQREMRRRTDALEHCEGGNGVDSNIRLPELLVEIGCYFVDIDYIPRSSRG